jgi:hypothetical protein
MEDQVNEPKYIPFPTNGIYCKCGLALFVVWIDDSDYGDISCPICGKYSPLRSPNKISEILGSEDTKKYPQKYYLEFCNRCNILFDRNCTHAVNGCSTDTLYSLLVSRFKFNGIWYDGMPIFDSYKDYLRKIKDYDLELKCSCQDGRPCIQSGYPEHTFLEEYCNGFVFY